MKFSLSLLCGFLLCWSCQSNPSKTPIRIATAANMQFVMEELVAVFEEQTDVECEVVLSSSGKLSVQIQAGAPYDLFLSADEKYPKSVCAADWCLGVPRTYAFGRLVLWTSLEVDEVNWSILNQKATTFVALANPKTAPYGRAAQEVLEAKQLWDTLQEKIVMGESIAQTNQFLLTGAARVGLTARSATETPQMKKQGRWMLIPDVFHQPIRQDVVLLKSAQPDARLFYDFLFSTEAKAILEQYGYLLPH
jgi:molybdate transport system substrate-binding protein